MMERYAVVAGRIRQELVELERVVTRAERAIAAARQSLENQDLYLDSAALNLHDFYAGLERIFRQIAATVDQSVPSEHDWHRELLRQMTVDLPQVRPQVLSVEAAHAIDEFLRFRHIVRNIYTFEFDADRIEHLVRRLEPSFEQARTELLAFAEFLDRLAQKA
ncbi:MAG: hypothetical protein PVF77_15765 [Anaerolineae bacterium]|jgi:hypothetical protein